MKNFKNLFTLVILVLFTFSCDIPQPQPTESSSGVAKATVKVQTGSNGLTVEQTNVAKRLKEDNTIGAIKHLYIISAMSGEVIIYSTVDGKVTSGGKRLTPKTTGANGAPYSGDTASIITLGDKQLYTQEVIQDDGTFGDSMNYLYWWDVKGVYHQHYVTGGQIVHISSQALPVSKITINLSN